MLLILAGLINLLVEQGLPRLRGPRATTPVVILGLAAIDPTNSRWIQMAWLFLKTGLFSFGGAYASLIFLQRGAVDQHHWLTSGQLLDGVALSVATPGPFMLFVTFVGYLAAGIPGAMVATFFVFLPSFVFVIGGAHYIEQVRNNHSVQAFLAGVSAAVVGVILAVSLELLPEALVDLPSIVIAVIAFALIVLVKVDIAFVAAGAIAAGIAYAALRALA
jgi:chromate transporter